MDQVVFSEKVDAVLADADCYRLHSVTPSFGLLAGQDHRSEPGKDVVTMKLPEQLWRSETRRSPESKRSPPVRSAGPDQKQTGIPALSEAALPSSPNPREQART